MICKKQFMRMKKKIRKKHLTNSKLLEKKQKINPKKKNTQ